VKHPFVFLQTSDWHVGSTLSGRALGLSSEQREKRRDEVDDAGARAVRAALDVGADAMLVPGDLWDAESVPPTCIHRLLEAFASFAPRPVFIAPGNHDFCGPAGWYDPAVLSALGMRAWPENVFVFRGADWETLRLDGREDVAVVGRAYLSPALTAERPLATPPPHPGVEHSVLLLHGSFEGYRGLDSASGAKATAPFSRAEVLSAGFEWAALGHHHHFQVIEDESGAPRAAYSGCPTGRGLDETGPRVFLKVTLASGEAPRVETVSADARVVRDLALDVSHLDSHAIQERLEALFVAEGVGPLDLVRVTLAGHQSYGARPAVARDPIASRAYHLIIRDKTAPAPEAEPVGLRTAEGRFAADLQLRREKAPDDAARRVVDLALSLGREALAGRALRPPSLDEP
jgi:DNA repair exonuclease SbcCD nuclease subunit